MIVAVVTVDGVVAGTARSDGFALGNRDIEAHRRQATTAFLGLEANTGPSAAVVYLGCLGGTLEAEADTRAPAAESTTRSMEGLSAALGVGHGLDSKVLRAGLVVECLPKSVELAGVTLDHDSGGRVTLEVRDHQAVRLGAGASRAGAGRYTRSTTRLLTLGTSAGARGARGTGRARGAACTAVHRVGHRVDANAAAAGLAGRALAGPRSAPKPGPASVAAAAAIADARHRVHARPVAVLEPVGAAVGAHTDRTDLSAARRAASTAVVHVLADVDAGTAAIHEAFLTHTGPRLADRAGA